MPDTDSNPSDPATNDSGKVDKDLPPAATKTDSGGSDPGTNDGPKSDKDI